MTSELEPSELWDAWKRESGRNPQLTPEQFCRSLLDGSLELLTTMLDVESEGPPSSLIDLLVNDVPLREFAGYRILRTIGQGSFGIVFLARKGDDGPEVALKVLNPLLASVASRRNLILREAEIAARLRHPGIVGVIGSG